MTRSNSMILVPGARTALDMLKGEVLLREGYNVTITDPDHIKYEVALELGIPLDRNYNGEIKARNAGKIGGEIGGKMVRAMIAQFEQNLLRY